MELGACMKERRVNQMRSQVLRFHGARLTLSPTGLARGALFAVSEVGMSKVDTDDGSCIDDLCSQGETDEQQEQAHDRAIDERSIVCVDELSVRLYRTKTSFVTRLSFEFVWGEETRFELG